MQRLCANGTIHLPRFSKLASIDAKRWLSVCLVLPDGSVRVDNDDGQNGTTPLSPRPPPGPGQVAVKLLAAPCTPADLRTLAAAATATSATAAPTAPTISRPQPEGLTAHGSNSNIRLSRSPQSESHSPNNSHPVRKSFQSPFVGGSEGVWEVIARGNGVSQLRPGDLVIPATLSAHEENAGTWRTSTTLAQELLVRVPVESGVGCGGWPELAVAAHLSSSVSTAIRILEDFAGKELGEGDRVVFTGASSAVAQILLQLAAARGLESVCLVNSDAEAALALELGAWKASTLKEFKAMRMNNARLVADGEGGVLGFTSARALTFRGCYVSYADVSGDGVRLPVAGQIFSDTKCRGFSISRWASTRPAAESRDLVKRSVETASAIGLRLKEAREFDLKEAVTAVDAARTAGGPVLLRG